MARTDWGQVLLETSRSAVCLALNEAFLVPLVVPLVAPNFSANNPLCISCLGDTNM